MNPSKTSDFQRDPYLRIIRPLVQAYLAFYRVGSRHIEQLGVTPAQFDVLAELGGTEGMTCADLSEATLITKGTLTGVLDRLETKGLLERKGTEMDRRTVHVQLTRKGQALYRRIFPIHGDFLRPYFKEIFTPGEIDALSILLNRIRDRFEQPRQEASDARRKLNNGKTC